MKIFTISSIFKPRSKLVVSVLCWSVILIVCSNCIFLDDVCSKDDKECRYPNIKSTGTQQVGTCQADNVLRRIQGTSFLKCVKECMMTSQCTCINYRKNWKICDVTGAPSQSLIKESGCIYSSIDSWSKKLAGLCNGHPCPEGTKCQLTENGDVTCILAYCKDFPHTKNATCEEKFGLHKTIGMGSQFSCNLGFKLIGRPFSVFEKTGQWRNLFCCMRVGTFRDCGDIPSRSASGIYKINPTGCDEFEVFCDMETEGGKWTVFQRRYNGETHFNRNWSEYEQGFGDLNKEHLLGNLKLHQITSSRRYRLRIEMEIDGDIEFAEYDTFSIGNAATNYKLAAEGHSGTLDNDLDYNNGMGFSTPDKDNDNRVNGHCANRWDSGWWFNGTIRNKCSFCNLNGNYNIEKLRWKGIVWYPWDDGWSPFNSTKMMIRR